MTIFPTAMTVVAAALIDADGRIFMHQRRTGAVHGGLWEFPGGKVEAGETPESALSRELNEELGITCQPDAFIAAAFATAPNTPKMGGASIVLLLYTCRAWHGVPQCLAGEAMDWFAPEAIKNLDMPPLDQPLASQLVAMLHHGLI